MTEHEFRITVLFSLGLLAVLIILFQIVNSVWYDKQNSKLNKIIKQTACTHGESSIQAYLGNDGKFHVTTPKVTGCVR